MVLVVDTIGLWKPEPSPVDRAILAQAVVGTIGLWKPEPSPVDRAKLVDATTFVLRVMLVVDTIGLWKPGPSPVDRAAVALRVTDPEVVELTLGFEVGPSIR